MYKIVSKNFNKFFHWLKTTSNALMKIFYSFFCLFLLFMFLQLIFAQISIWKIAKTGKSLAPRLLEVAVEHSQMQQLQILFKQDIDSVKKYIAMPTSTPVGFSLKQEDKSELAKIDNRDLFNVLIVGKNENLTDTLILVVVNEARQEIVLISIPRDLYWGGRKINSYYAAYGMSGLRNQLERITGLAINKYALVDIYAFIEAVNIMGGLDICLDKALIDITYKTNDNGQEGYLHFEPGCQHIDGKQALRLARSRYSDSDFHRSDRQQNIIKAVQEKALKMGFGDIGKLTIMGRAILNKLDTNISLQEALQYYLKYYKYKLKGNNVMSTNNIFYSTKNSSGQYILLPLHDQWYRIKQYVFNEINK